jgi:hypothetical protein
MGNPEIDESGNKRWYLGNVLHRTDGPACEYINGNKMWYANDEVHRADGPAIEWYDGDLGWFLNGNGYSFDQWLELNPVLTHEQKVMMKLQYG